MTRRQSSPPSIPSSSSDQAADTPEVKPGRWLRRALLPLVPLYAAANAARSLAYTQGWLPTAHLQAPVISVGNLSVGGAGKTPLVICLAQLLAARGLDVDVLSRGYGRRSQATELVNPDDPDGHEESPNRSPAERFGDEPLLITRAAKVPVYVGPSRYPAGLLAEQRPANLLRVHLLDDGFQHRQLARAVDIVVLHRSDFSGSLLPAGRLREPLSALRRATVAVLRVEDAHFAPAVQRFGVPIWWMEREIALPEAARDHPAVAFCGIARPAEFVSALTRAGAALTATHPFPDHHAYTAADLPTLAESVRSTGARLLLTTEKDLVRLSAAHRSLLSEAAPLHAVPLRARLLNQQAALDQLLTLAGLPHLSR